MESADPLQKTYDRHRSRGLRSQGPPQGRTFEPRTVDPSNFFSFRGCGIPNHGGKLNALSHQKMRKPFLTFFPISWQTGILQKNYWKFASCIRRYIQRVPLASIPANSEAVTFRTVFPQARRRVKSFPLELRPKCRLLSNISVVNLNYSDVCNVLDDPWNTLQNFEIRRSWAEVTRP